MKPKIELNDIDKEFNTFKRFTLNEQRKVILTSLRKGAKYIIQKTKKTFRSRLKKSTKPNPKYSDKLIDAVRRSSTDFEKDEGKVYVHILGTRKSTSGTFRARFFEQGTDDRYVKRYGGKKLSKKRFVGKIKPLWYFRDSVNQSKEEYKRIVSTEVNRMVNKINMENY